LFRHEYRSCGLFSLHRQHLVEYICTCRYNTGATW
jgi:hypothetical protein